MSSENIKGIILAGGAGTRLHPITKGVSKQLLPVYDKPMIYYPLSTLMLAGIRDILIITTPEDQDAFIRLLGDGGDFGIHLTYAIQEKPNGLAEAFIIGKDFIGNDAVCLILGDNIFHGPGLTKKLQNAVYKAVECDIATVFGYYVKDPQRYGVVEFEKLGSEFDNIYPFYFVKSIEEKPENPKSNYAVVGLYFYPNDVVRIAQEIEPSERGELEITEVNNRFLNHKKTVYTYPINSGYSTTEKLDPEKWGEPSSTYDRVSCKLTLELFDRGFAWLDTGTFESLSNAANYVETIEKRQGMKISCLEEIAYNKGWIDKVKLIELGQRMAKNEYGQYLLEIANKESE